MFARILKPSLARVVIPLGGSLAEECKPPAAETRSGSQFSISGSAPTTARGRPRALVIDDDRLIRTLLERVLTHAGYDVAVGADGSSAISMSRDIPDVVVLDMHLPDVSGLSVCRAIRANPATHAIPIVVLTGEDDGPTSVASFQAGADDFVRKPFIDEVLVMRVNRIVSAQVNERRAQERHDELTEAYRALNAARADATLKHRLSGLGILTAGLAHEMNSPLGALIASLQFAIDDKTATQEDIDGALADALTASQRIAELVRRMRSIAGADDRTHTDVSLRARCMLIADAFPAPANITVEGDEFLVSAVDSEVREALVAIIDNAVRASSSTPVPAVRITLASTPQDVTVQVDDNGAGIDENDLPHVFDPFFTRHRSLRGKGLGLSLALAAARRHGGTVTIEPHGPLGGCSVRFTLPVARGHAEETVSGLVLLKEFVASTKPATPR